MGTPQTRRRRLSVVAATFTVVAMAIVPAAHAAYPGKPGNLAIDSELNNPGGDNEIYLMSPGGIFLSQLTFNVLGNVEDDDDPAFSGDGNRIVWEGDTDPPAGGDDEIFIMNSDGSGQTQLTPTSNTGDNDSDPAISRDGKLIVFERDDPVAPNDDEIFIMDSGGGAVTQLTFNGGGNDSDQDPVFSPDGKKIYFESNRTAGNNEIWVMNVDGTDQRQLTSTPFPRVSSSPDVSQDGRRIVFTSDRNGVFVPMIGAPASDVWVMDADGTDPVQLTFDANLDSAPVFSPDSARIAFSYTPPDLSDTEIVVMNADGSERIELTANNFVDSTPDWQPIPVRCKGKTATLVGTDGKDKLVGTNERDVIVGLGGKDKIKGKGGKDRLCGGKGGDKLSGGGGDDKLVGGKGDDDLNGGKGDDQENQ